MRRQWAVALVAYAAVVIACSHKSVAKVTVPDQAVSPSDVAVVPLPIPNETTTWSRCPSDMVEVDGDYCTNAREVCLRWVGVHGETVPPPGGKFPTGRCGEWKYPTTCAGRTVHKHYCVDTYEYPNHEGERPKAWMDWYDVRDACKAEGKRLCTKEEWTFACEGPDMQPYPYKGPGAHPGYTRDKTACNFDNLIPEDPTRPVDPKTGKHGRISVFDAKRPTDRVSGILNDLLVPAGSMPACVSPWGVHDMVGNIDEFVENTAIPEHSPKAPYRSGLMSGHVFGVRNQCRAITDGHNEWFGWYETGGRCCSDPQQKD